MGKQNRHTKGVAVHQGKDKGVHYEQHESYDDSLLPDAVELEKLKALDPKVMEWIKDRTAKEQDGRLDFNKRKMALLEKGQICMIRIDAYSITCALIIVLAGMGLSAYLIHKGDRISGSLFGGGTLLIAISAFLNFRKNKNTQT